MQNCKMFRFLLFLAFFSVKQFLVYNVTGFVLRMFFKKDITNTIILLTQTRNINGDEAIIFTLYVIERELWS